MSMCLGSGSFGSYTGGCITGSLLSGIFGAGSESGSIGGGSRDSYEWEEILSLMMRLGSFMAMLFLIAGINFKNVT